MLRYSVILLPVNGAWLYDVRTVCLSVCLSVRSLNLWKPWLNLETSFLACTYIFRISRSSSYIEVIGSRSRLQEQKLCLLTFKCIDPQTIFGIIISTSKSSIGFTRSTSILNRGYMWNKIILKSFQRRYCSSWIFSNMFINVAEINFEIISELFQRRKFQFQMWLHVK